MEQVHGRRASCEAGGPREQLRRPGHRPPRRGADGPGRRLRAGAARRPGRRGRRRGARRPQRAGRGRRRRPASTRCASSARPISGVGRAAHLRRLLRGARGAAATRSPPSSPAAVATTSWGTPALDIGAGVRAQLERAGVRGQRRLALHLRVAGPLLPPPRRGASPAGRRRGLITADVACASAPRTPDDPRAELARAGHGARAHRRRLRATPAAAATRSPSSWSPSSSPPPTSGCWPTSASATSVRTVTRRRWQKAAECADLDVRWHFIGGLQSNKAAAVAPYADVVHSVDRAKLVGGPEPGRARSAAVSSTCLVQVSLDPPDASGRSAAASPPTCPRSSSGSGRPRGSAARCDGGRAPRRGRRRGLRAAGRDRLPTYAGRSREATWISAGMSGDLEQAVRHGATHLRIGSAVLGPRPVVK